MSSGAAAGASTATDRDAAGAAGGGRGPGQGHRSRDRRADHRAADRRPGPRHCIGSGKVEEIAKLVEETEAELVVVNAQLSPIQQRNLEKAWGAKVLDRTGLILEIFGRRASTREGTLQVELAHLQYQKSRLVRSWTHLERQRGGFGFLGGPGESQLEADRRLIQERITRIEKQLTSVVKTRALHRKGRARVPYPVVALVGYTNAGKSTLFNRLSGAEVLAKDLLFATLDPTMRVIALPHGRKIILSDTVGFISDLPTSLIAAFRATLEEVLEADVILHVRDVSHAETEAQAADVNRVLDELGIDEVRRGADHRGVEQARPARSRGARHARSAGPAQARLRARLRRDRRGLAAALALVEDRLGAEDASLRGLPRSGRRPGPGLAARPRRSARAARTIADGRVRLTVRLDRGHGRPGAWRGSAGRCGCRPKRARGGVERFTCLRPLASFHRASISARFESFGCLPALCQALLDMGEAAHEFRVGAAQRRLRIDAQMAGHIGHGEEDVAEFLRLLVIGRGAELGHFLGDLVVDIVDRRPVEANLGRLGLKLHGAGQAGQGDGNASSTPASGLVLGVPWP